MAYAQREVLVACIAAVKGTDSGVAGTLQPLVALWALRCVDADLAWLLTQELVTLPLARAVPGTLQWNVIFPLYPACVWRNGLDAIFHVEYSERQVSISGR